MAVIDFKNILFIIIYHLQKYKSDKTGLFGEILVSTFVSEEKNHRLSMFIFCCGLRSLINHEFLC